MKESDLAVIDFKKRLQYCYEDVQPLLIVELDKLRAALIALAEDSSELEKLALFEQCVIALNAVNDDKTLIHHIDTVEREALCDLLYKMGDHLGLNRETNYIDKWRDW